MQVLSLNGQDGLTDEAICVVATCAPLLCSLDLRSTDTAAGFTDAGVCHLSRLTGLTALRMSCCQVRREYLQAIPSMSLAVVADLRLKWLCYPPTGWDISASLYLCR